MKYKLFTATMVLMTVAFFVFMHFDSRRSEGARDQCAAKGGVELRTRSGDFCIAKGVVL